MLSRISSPIVLVHLWQVKTPGKLKVEDVISERSMALLNAIIFIGIVPAFGHNLAYHCLYVSIS